MTKVGGVTRRDLEALALLRAEQGVLRRGDRRVRPSTMGRLVAMRFAALIGAESSDDGIARHVLTEDGADHLAAREGRGPSCWSLVVDGVPACISIAHDLPVGCSSSSRSELRRWKQVVEKHFPDARVELVPGACDPNPTNQEG